MKDKKDSKNGFDHDCLTFSELLRSVLASNSPVFGLKGQNQISWQETLVGKKVQEVGEPLELQPETTEHGNKLSSHALTRIPVIHSAPAMPSAVPNCGTGVSHKVLEVPALDEYNWRKYGQKQVKGTASFRSYFKCTHSGCHAKKKVQQCAHSGDVIDIVYISQHNHGPPEKKCNRSRMNAPLPNIALGSHIEDPSAQNLEGSDMSIYQADTRQSSSHIPALEQRSTSSSGFNAGIKVEGQYGYESESKQIVCSSGSGPQQSRIADTDVQEKENSEPWPKKTKKETGTICSDDGYRWRKYGQKMVKGNSLARSYYRCTFARCPARKHVETATNDAQKATVTYEGIHDHDMLVPKKQHSPENPALVSSSPCMLDANHNKTKNLSSQNPSSSTKMSEDGERDLIGKQVLELGDEKALELAQTLLSIGINVRPR